MQEADPETRQRLSDQDARIRARYDRLSDTYQASKDTNAIPLN